MTKFEKIKNKLIGKEGQYFTSSEINEKLEAKYSSSFLPSDHCYNRINKQEEFEKFYEKYPPIFIRKKHNKYKYVGEQYKYNDYIYWNSKGGDEKVVGEWESGIPIFFENRFFNDIIYPDEISKINILEGSKNKIFVNSYERNSNARKKCIKKYGYSCQACGFNFEQQYGSIGKNFIEVHHIVPISTIGKEYKINPTKDLIPVCSNCHMMIHKRNPPYSVEEIKKIKNSYKVNHDI